MIDLEMITNPTKYLADKGELKRGYKLSDKKEFEAVRKTIVSCNLSPKNFDNNLATLIIKSENAEKNSVAGTYNPTSNAINYPKLYEDKIHELFHMASNDMSVNKGITGIEQEGNVLKFGSSANEGITDYFTKLTVPDYKYKYPTEASFASYLADMYGMKIFDYYFTADPEGFYEEFGPNKFLVRDFVGVLDEYHNKSLSFFQSFEPNSKTSMRLASELTDLFIKSCVQFADLVAMNEGDVHKYLDDLRNTLSDHDNNISGFLNVAFIYSGFGDLDKVFKAIYEEVKRKEGFGL